MATKSDVLKIPPHDAEAEKSALGALLIDSSAINIVAEFLKSEHFYLPEHQSIYSAMLSLFEKQKPIDVITLQDQLKDEGTLKKIGGKKICGMIGEKPKQDSLMNSRENLNR